MLILVAYHPGSAEVARLQSCLEALAPSIGVTVVVNEARPGEPVEALRGRADLFLACPANQGYGRAVNRAVAELRSRGCLPPLLGALNTDLCWAPGSFETALAWLEAHPDVALAVPQIVDAEGRVQQLCKRDPSVLALLSRRFLPDCCKPRALRRYDARYVMAEHDYSQSFEVPYLSGCCMLIRSRCFEAVGGFDPRYFLYLEDADLTRSLRRVGRCVHLPLLSVWHHWGRGNHRSLRLTLVNLHSAWIYFRKWGLRWR